MNEEELKALLVSNPLLKFSSYYKYTFTFAATILGEYSVVASFGGNHDDIYRAEVKNDAERNLFPLENWNFVSVMRGEEKVFEKYDF